MEKPSSNFLAKVESANNSRPLTASSDYIQDVLSLTPNHFLISCLPPSNPLQNISKNIVNFRTKRKAAHTMGNMF